MIVIITKVLCYHQVYIADDLYRIYKDNFKFVQMREPLDWRIKNKQEGFERPYLVSYQKNPKIVLDLIKNADVIIFGEAPLKLIRHKNKKCLLFKMSENIYKDTFSKISLFGRIKRRLSYSYLRLLTNNNHSYLLSCGAFAYRDYFKLNIFKNRGLKWGYFPYVPNVNENIIKNKFDNLDKIELIWVSRLIEWKKPFYLIYLVEQLIKRGITNFHLTIVGNSDESDADYYSMMKNEISEKGLSSFITMAGKVNADKVFDYYLKAHIALFTSDKSEGWSVGIGEAMSCGCTVVSSNTVGAAPFLIGKDNGVIFEYSSVEDFSEKVISLLENRSMIKTLSFNGFEKIQKIWNHENAAVRLSKIIDEYLVNKTITCCDDGPCSKVRVLNYDWYLEK